MTMATVVKKGLVSPLGRGDSVAISISSSSGATAVLEALAPVWERLATMGEYGEGPSYRSDPMRVVAAGGEACWLVVLTLKG